MRLTTKLCLVQVGFAAAVLALSLVPLTLTERRRLLEQLQARQKADTEQFGYACANALEEANEPACVTHLRTLILQAEHGMVAYAVFLDAAGRVVVHSDFVHGDESLKGKSLREPELHRALESELGLRQPSRAPRGPVEVLSTPIIRSDSSGAMSRAGTVAIAFDNAAVDRYIKALRSDWAFRWFVATFPGVFLGIVLALLLAGALSRPIQDLSDGARLIGLGKLEARIPAIRSDELGDLAREFNTMAAKLAELDELKDGFLAQITHDLRNPLAAIASYADVLLMGMMGQITDKQRKALKIIAVSTGHLNDLIGNILDITRMEAGRLELAPADVDFAALAQSVVDLMRAKADEYEIALDLRSVPDGVQVWADEAALRRVLVNLLSNALKFTPKGGRVSLTLSASDGMDRVAVSDTGIGIPADKLHTLFQKFAQIAETKNKVRAVHGTGLGLVICKQIVEGHGGKIGVESVYQQGTTFHFSLPRKPATSADRGTSPASV